jgi:sugar O-acyltransferase (sialic acid O-acetyltransferase NeuD family)
VGENNVPALPGAPIPVAGEQCFVLWGSAGHAKVLSSLIALRGGRVVALFDNREVPSALVGVALYVGEAGFKRWASETTSRTSVIGLVAIGGDRGRDRMAIHALFRRYGLQVSSLVHPAASVCASAHIGAGTQVLAQAVVAAEVRIGEACIVNHGAVVDHECALGNGVHIAPGATLCGCVTLGDNVMVGAGAVVLPRLSVGADSVIGAGAVVTKNIIAGVTVVGNPGRVVMVRRR